MCFEPDSSPPIAPSGGAASRRLVLEASDGNRFVAFEAVGGGAGAAVVVLPDVRGLFRFYEELAVRLAEAGHDAVAIDYFGRTAGLTPRDDAFEFMPHVERTTFDGLRYDVAAAVAHLRTSDPARPVVTLGFCFGGSNSWFQASTGVGLAGVIGFYGHPDRERPPGGGTVMSRISRMSCPLLGLMAGDDPGIPQEVVHAFDEALTVAGLDHEIVSYQWIIIAAIVGTLVGIPLSWVPLTAVPQRTALSHAFGGLAAGPGRGLGSLRRRGGGAVGVVFGRHGGGAGLFRRSARGAPDGRVVQPGLAREAALSGAAPGRDRHGQAHQRR